MIAVAIASLLFAVQNPIYRDPKADIDKRIDDLVSRMTLDEKASLCSGQDSMALPAIPRLGIPSLTMADGPLGLRHGTSTAYPANILMGSTWDPELVRQCAKAMADEFLGRGRYLMLGPCVGLVRVPGGGRNMESYGEDPFLNGTMAAEYILAAQAQGAATCLKHYALNNQEYERGSIDIRADERTMRELDLRVFEMAVRRGGTLSVMAAYNKVNGAHCSENDYLQNQVLKKEWGFKGAVVSDWGAVHSLVESFNNGCDVEMPGPGWFWGNGKLAKAVKDGKIKQAVLDDKVRRILYILFKTGAFDKKPLPAFKYHPQQALKAAEAGIVLLKNKGGLLPIDKAKSIALIGAFADASISGGGGSSKVDPPYATTVKQGLIEAGIKGKLETVPALDRNGVASGSMEDSLQPADGWKAEFFNGTNFEGTPLTVRTDPKINFDWGNNAPASGVPNQKYCIRWTGTIVAPESTEYSFRTESDDGIRVYVNGKRIINAWHDHGVESAGAVMSLVKGEKYEVKVEYYNNLSLAVAKLFISNPKDMFEKAIAAAKKADRAIVVVGNCEQNEGEGWDRNPVVFPGVQQALLDEVLKANPNTIVVLVGGSQQTFGDWWDRAPAIVEAWYPGQEGGRAVANILTGKVNPSGKLPMTFFKKWEDHPCFGNYPGNIYSEGLLLGYRWIDAKKIEPLFPFGHGLSYTQFAYSGLKVEPAGMETVRVHFTLKNTGKVAGSEVAQVYVAPINPPVEKAPKALEGFTKVFLKPGQSKKVVVTLPCSAFWRFDPAKQAWILDKGEYGILVGASSQDIKLSGKVKKGKTLTFPKGITQIGG